MIVNQDSLSGDAKTYADHLVLLSTAQELRGKYGNSASARVWRCSRTLRKRGDARSETVCLQLAKIIDTLASD